MLTNFLAFIFIPISYSKPHDQSYCGASWEIKDSDRLFIPE